MKVITVTTFWNRPNISRIFWEQCREIGLDVIAVVTEGDHANINLAERLALKTVYMSNDNLPAKWQAGMEVLKQYEFDYFILLGSDDLISKRYFTDVCNKQAKANVLYFGLRDALAYSIDAKKFRYWRGYPEGLRHNESIGPGRMIHKSVLKKIDFKLFSGAKGGPDRGAHMTILNHKVPHKLIASGLLPYRIGLKDHNAISKIVKSAPFNQTIDLKEFYSENIINMIRHESDNHQ